MTAIEVIPDSSFGFEGMMIERVIIHRIHNRTVDKQPVDPRTSNKLIRLDQEALDALQMRITKALGNRSHGIEMSIRDADSGRFFQVAASMLHSGEEAFILASKGLAHALNYAQLSVNAPGGLLAVVSGRIGNTSYPFIAVIKAEPQDGFKADEQDDYVGMEYISELLLTDAQRFYKIGLLSEITSHPPSSEGYCVNNFRAFLFDHLVTATETRSAAAYFYGSFLGMDIQKSSKKLTQNFFEFTQSYIDTASLPDDEKLDLHEALRSELRSQDNTLSSAEFAKKHLKSGSRQEYESFMKGKGFPLNSIIKDTDYIRAKLKRRRKYVFNNDVWISTPPDKAGNFIEIESAQEEGITLVKIKGQLQRQS